MNLKQLQKNFVERYGLSEQPIRLFYAPGRVNLMGDHTDYNGGLVFPCAINYGTMLLIRQSRDDTVKLGSADFDLVAILSRDQIGQPYGDYWINYPLGIINQFARRGIHVPGFECLYAGNVPNGAGLSSSASIEVVTAYAISKMIDSGLPMMELIKLSQAAENEFVGVACGIMDQCAVALGQQDHIMSIDCSTLKITQVPARFAGYSLLVANTNQRRELSESHYNTRVSQTREALEKIRRADAALNRPETLASLSQLSPEELLEYQPLFDNSQDSAETPVERQSQTLYARARHVVTENRRVRQAIDALTESDIREFGQLMLQSHQSLRDDYAVSSIPLDALFDAATAQPGVLGARLTGAGFGGCTINLVENDQVDAFMQNTGSLYNDKTGLSADFYPVSPSEGVHERQPDEVTS